MLMHSRLKIRNSNQGYKNLSGESVRLNKSFEKYNHLAASNIGENFIIYSA